MMLTLSHIAIYLWPSPDHCFPGQKRREAEGWAHSPGMGSWSSAPVAAKADLDQLCLMKTG